MGQNWCVDQVLMRSDPVLVILCVWETERTFCRPALVSHIHIVFLLLACSARCTPDLSSLWCETRWFSTVGRTNTLEANPYIETTSNKWIHRSATKTHKYVPWTTNKSIPKLKWQETSKTSYFPKFYENIWPIQKHPAGVLARALEERPVHGEALNLSFICFLAKNVSLSAMIGYSKWTEKQEARLWVPSRGKNYGAIKARKKIKMKRNRVSFVGLWNG